MVCADPRLDFVAKPHREFDHSLCFGIRNEPGPLVVRSVSHFAIIIDFGDRAGIKLQRQLQRLDNAIVVPNTPIPPATKRASSR